MTHDDRDERGYPYPRAGGHRNAADRCSWTHWVVFDNDDIGAELDQAGDPVALATALTGWAQCYRGPGQPFAHPPHAARGRFHTLVTQHGGYDV